MSKAIQEQETDDGGTMKRLQPNNLDPGEEARLTLLARSEVDASQYGPYAYVRLRDRDTGEIHENVFVSSTFGAPGFVTEDDEDTALDERCDEDGVTRLPRTPEDAIDSDYDVDAYTFDRDDGGEVGARQKNILDNVFAADVNDDETVLLCFSGEAKSGRTYKTYFFGVTEGDGGGISWLDEDADAEAEAPA